MNRKKQQMSISIYKHETKITSPYIKSINFAQDRKAKNRILSIYWENEKCKLNTSTSRTHNKQDTMNTHNTAILVHTYGQQVPDKIQIMSMILKAAKCTIKQ